MDDREIVAAIVAGDLAALADAYDQYAESLYGYCHWMLNEPADAADAVQDTFVVAAARLGGLRDPRKLRPWLYAVARNECHRRLRGTQAGPDEAADVSGDPGDDTDRAELRGRVRSALAGLPPGEREVLELELRHDLHGADLAAVLGVSRNQAHALVLRTRGQLEKDLGALLVARTGRRGCRALDTLLAEWDGRLTAVMRKRISGHADQCEVCGKRRRGALRNAALFGMAPLAVLPEWLREDMLRLCSDYSQLTLAYRQEVTLRAGPFGPNGFPRAIRPPRQRALALARIAAAAGIVIAVASAGIITVLALKGSHAPHSLDAARASGRPVTSSAPAGPAGSAGAPASVPPTASQPATAGQDPATVPAPSAPATTAKPSPSHSKTASAPAPKPTPSPTPTPTPTPTVTTPPPTTPPPTTPPPTSPPPTATTTPPF
jgi:RNA polymerase sigma factor (sigma-70 family)